MLDKIELKYTLADAQKDGLLSDKLNAALNPNDISETINEIINTGLIKAHSEEPKRDYLGASQIGEECLRKIQYSYKHLPSNINPRSLRTFDIGHILEDLMIKWLRTSGFSVLTVNTDTNNQFGFTTANGQIAGHVDGIIIASPSGSIKTPCILECKTMNKTNFAETVKHGVFIAKPIYYTQVQLYMAYVHPPKLNMPDPPNSTLFMAVNKDTSELYFELIPFDSETAQRASDKAVSIINMTNHNETAPRLSNNPTFFKCQMCEYKEICSPNCRPEDKPQC